MTDPELGKLLEGTQFTVEKGETLMRRGVANFFRGPEAVGGRLWLTNRRLIFRSHGANIQTGVWAWPLAAIGQVEPVNTLGIVPNGLLVTVRTGEGLRFVVRKRRAWMTDIDRARRCGAPRT